MQFLLLICIISFEFVEPMAMHRDIFAAALDDCPGPATPEPRGGSTDTMSWGSDIDKCAMETRSPLATPPLKRMNLASTVSGLPSAKKHRKICKAYPWQVFVEISPPLVLPCIFVNVTPKSKIASDSHTSVCSISLWPQYAQHGSLDTYLKMSTMEEWVTRLISAVRAREVDKVHRAIAHKLAKTINPMFRDAILAGRKPCHVIDSDDDGSSDYEKSAKRSKVEKTGLRKACVFRDVAALSITLGGHNITSANCMRPMFLKVNTEGIAVVHTFLVALIRDLKATSAPCLPAVERTNLFQFCNSGTPNVRGKVVWDPMKGAWKVLAKKSKSPFEPLLPAIDIKLPQQEFDALKLTSYRAAVKMWNDLDNSSRHRIPALVAGCVDSVSDVVLTSEDAGDSL
jgi:hypothetical protein